jgi:hypothetical protein
MKVALITGFVVLAVGAVADSGTNAPVSTNAIPVLSNAAPGIVVAPPVVVTPPVPAPDPMVGKALMALGAVLQSSKHFRCQVTFLINSEMEGMKQEISASYALAVERPNRLALRFLKGMTGNTVVCDGKKMITYAAALNRYEEKEAPRSFEQFTQGLGPMSGNILFVDNLLRDDIYAAIMDGVIKARYAGKVMMDGQECDHLKFEQDQFDWELWVTSGLKPVVVQVVYDMAKSFTVPGGEPVPAKGMKMTVLNRFSDWVMEGVLPSDTFEFKPPAGAHKAESLFEGEEEEPPGRAVPVDPGMDVKTNAN